MPDGAPHPLSELGPDSPDLLDPAAELRLPEVSDAARTRFAEQLAAWRTREAGPGGSIHGFRPGAGLAGRSFSRGEPFVLRAAFGLNGGEVARPSVPRIEAGIRAVKAAMAHLEPDARGPLAACAAWLEWALGRGSLAGAFLDTALALKEPSAFALVLGLRLQRGVLPEWAFREQPGLSIEEQLRRIA
jgi:hypothetical protein